MKILVFIVFAVTSLLSRAEIDFLHSNSDQLARLLGSGRGLDVLEAKLQSPDARLISQRLVADEKLKQFVYLKVARVNDPKLRDELLMTYILDHELWSRSVTSMRDGRILLASTAADAILKSFPKLRAKPGFRNHLELALHSKQGRVAISEIYRQLSKMKYSENPQLSGEMDALGAELERVSVKYGVKDYVIKGAANSLYGGREEEAFSSDEEKSSLQPLPTQQQPIVEHPKEVKDSTMLVGSRLLTMWAAVASGIVVALCLLWWYRRR